MENINLPIKLSIKMEMGIKLKEAWLFNSNIVLTFLMALIFTINFMITNFWSLLVEEKCMGSIKPLA